MTGIPLDMQTSQQEGCQTWQDNVSSHWDEMQGDLDYDIHKSHPAGGVMTGIPLDMQTSQQEGCQTWSEDVSSHWEEMPDLPSTPDMTNMTNRKHLVVTRMRNIKHPADTPYPENNIPNLNCWLRGNFAKESLENIKNIPNNNLFMKQPAKISADCDWSNLTNSEEVRYVRKRKGEELTSTKTKKLRICGLNIQ